MIDDMEYLRKLLVNNGRRYVKKPVPVLAIQIDDEFKVETLEGTMVGKKGDYLVMGIKGELYPVDREIFEQTYEPVEGTNNLRSPEGRS